MIISETINPSENSKFSTRSQSVQKYSVCVGWCDNLVTKLPQSIWNQGTKLIKTEFKST